jgi:hypothetical protein
VGRFARAQQAASARGEDVMAVAASLGDAAVEKCLARFARQLTERGLLRDVLALQEAFAGALPGSLPADFERLRLVPDALLQWMDDALGLVPSEDEGEFEMPAAKLSRFVCETQPAIDSKGLVRVRVTVRGWKRNGTTLVPAQVRICED